MTRLVVAAVFVSACVGATRPVPAPPAAGQDGQPAAVNTPGDAAPSANTPAADAAVTDGIAVWGAFDGPAENCRWEGYGIGPLGAGQCFIQHLAAHSANECFREGGFPFASRNIVDQCATEADEVQVLCCFANGIPAPAVVSIVFAPSETAMVLESVQPESRADLLSHAADTCTQSGMRLEDWSLRYAADGTTPDVLRFTCH
jgi:hypothetical protein